MLFKQVATGGDRNFSYIIADEQSREAAVIDPGNLPREELALVAGNDLKLKYIINTHDHVDHTSGNDIMAARSNADIVMHANAHSYHDIGVNGGDTLSLGEIPITIIHTPGHTPDSICILAEDQLFTGDTLFVGKVGGTGFGDDAKEEYDSLHKLMELPDDTCVWPGHNYGVRPASTIGEERRGNPFLLRDSFESFVDLKKNWLEYKREHGIK